MSRHAHEAIRGSASRSLITTGSPLTYASPDGPSPGRSFASPVDISLV
jgi:hypothetical protein